MALNSKSLILTVFFVAATMVSSIMSLRMVAPFGIVMDAGTLLYPTTFILRDLLHKDAGLKASDRAVSLSAICNAAMFALFAFAAWLPYDQATGPQAEYARVLLPGILIVVGSVTGQFISERIDGRIFHRIYDGGNHARAALTSNAVSIPIDTVIMCAIAFGFTIPFGSLVATIVSNIVIKYIVTLVFVCGIFITERRKAK